MKAEPGRPGRLGARGRGNGFALPLLLVLLLALTGLAHGVLVLARRQLEVSALSVRVLQAERAAEAAVAAAEIGWWEAGGVELGGEESAFERSGEGRLDPTVVYRWVVSSPAPEIVIVEAEGRAGDAPGWEVARTYWRAHPDVRTTSLGAVVEVGSGVEGNGAGIVSDPGRNGACPGDALPPLLPIAELPPDDTPGPPSLGHLGGAELLERSGAGVRATLPDDPERPDPGGLAVRIAWEDLRIGAGVRAEGLFLVGGDLVLEPGAEVVGAARVRGVVRLAETSRIVGDRCRVREALLQAPSLSVPLPVPGGSWLPLR